MTISIPIKDMTGAQNGAVEVAEALLVREKGSQAVKDAVVAYLTNCRQGTANTKTRGEVSGGGAKPWRQKGTGRARSGSNRSPVWRHGGVTFGPRTRSFEWNLSPRIRTLALQRAFTERVVAGDILIVDTISPKVPKTKEFVATINTLCGGENALVLVDSVDTNLRLASRNLPKVDVIRACDVSTYMMLLHKKVVMTKAAYDILVQRFTKEDAA
jgi:large subunit ribosomal protein L4